MAAPSTYRRSRGSSGPVPRAGRRGVGRRGCCPHPVSRPAAAKRLHEQQPQSSRVLVARHRAQSLLQEQYTTLEIKVQERTVELQKSNKIQTALFKLMDAASELGEAIKKRDTILRMAAANRAFGHFKW